jgi:hypothetical protein
MSEIDYAGDCAGECRINPSNGVAYVLRRVLPSDGVCHTVFINDIFGGHGMRIEVDYWLSWEVFPLRPAR